MPLLIDWTVARIEADGVLERLRPARVLFIAAIGSKLSESLSSESLSLLGGLGGFFILLFFFECFVVFFLSA